MMKKLTNFLLPIEIGINLDDVKSIIFKFQQGQKTMKFEYPSVRATRKENENIVLLRWTAADTMAFDTGRIVELDTFIRLFGSEENPWTAIAAVTMDRTLFTPEEVGAFD